MKELYCSNLKTVTNDNTNVKRYFINICGVWRRVSKKDYDDRTNESFRQDCFLTVTKHNLIHQYKTVYMYI